MSGEREAKGQDRVSVSWQQLVWVVKHPHSMFQVSVDPLVNDGFSRGVVFIFAGLP